VEVVSEIPSILTFMNKRNGKMHKYYLEMVIRSKKVDPDTVSQELSILPSQVSRIGEKHKPSKRKLHEVNTWAYWVDPSLQSELTDQCVQFVEVFTPKKEILKQLSRECELIVAFLVTDDNFNYAVNIEPEFIELCACINARLYFDFYLFGEDAIEEGKKD